MAALDLDFSRWYATRFELGHALPTPPAEPHEDKVKRLNRERQKKWRDKRSTNNGPQALDPGVHAAKQALAAAQAAQAAGAAQHAANVATARAALAAARVAWAQRVAAAGAALPSSTSGDD